MDKPDPVPSSEIPASNTLAGSTQVSATDAPKNDTSDSRLESPAPPTKTDLRSQHPGSPHSTTTVSHPTGYRVLANVVVVFVAMFLFVRATLLEPFGVPTGSMAPALIGNHRQVSCPRCEYPVRVGAPNGVPPEIQYDPDRVACPNCFQHVSLLEARDLNGDRLLVDKHVFNLRRPRRWEMVVFHCPDPDPKEYRRPYVKRVVGLPGEQILLIDGDVYVVNDDLTERDILRKGLAEVRETRVVVYDMSYVPKPGGWNQRWLAEPHENDPRLPERSGRRAEPADSSVVASRELTLDSSATPQTTATVTYRQIHLDTRTEEVIRAWNSYDGVPLKFGKPAFGSLDAAHDFSFECEVEVVSVSGSGRFTCRLTDGADGVTAEIPVGNQPNAAASITSDEGYSLASATGVRLAPRGTYRVEFSFVDRRAILAIDGKQVGNPTDLSPPSEKRHDVRGPLRLESRGCRLVIRNLKLYRDTHYTQYGEHGTFDEMGLPHPVVLGPNDYFMLGDNSGNSQDSRKWPSPGVPEGEIIGKPFLIHQPLRPGRMTIGGRERHYQTVDWSRLRWLH